MKNKKSIVSISVAVCVVMAFVSFWGGMKYGQSKNSIDLSSSRQGFNQGGFNQNGGGKIQGMRGGQGGGFINGEILSKDDTSMTIKLRDGGSRIVLFSPASKVEKTVDGSISDMIVGKSVMVTGTTNPDGSVSATSIQMRPTMPVPVKIN